MRKIILALMFVSLMVAGCGKNQDGKTTSGTKSDSVKVKTETAPSKTGTDVKDGQTKVDDIDGMIDSYEKVANKYIETSGKLKKGADATLTAELSSLAAKQIDLVGKLEHVKPNMNPKQLERYTGIAVKLESATK
ncbi:MAG: DUF6591 domain-containing protein [Ignavibacteria bacterium]|nr:hypothetical protein [Ignavibacteriota bacterium]